MFKIPAHKNTTHPAGQIVHPIGQEWKENLAVKAQMCQDEDNRLSRALSNTPNAREHARDAAAQITLDKLVEKLTLLADTCANDRYLEVNNDWYAQQIRKIISENT